MRLTDYTDYSLRVLLYLSVRPSGLSTIQEISDAYGVSKNHLMKIVRQLGELGWVETVRGRNGGLRLAKHSASFTIGDIVRKTESDFALVGCFGDASEHRGCVIESQCRLRGGVLAAARTARSSPNSTSTRSANARNPRTNSRGCSAPCRSCPFSLTRSYRAARLHRTLLPRQSRLAAPSRGERRLNATVILMRPTRAPILPIN